MNKARRKNLAEALTLLEQARDLLQEVCDEESEAYDNMPESLQDSERGGTMYEGIELMEELLYSLDDLDELWNL